MRCLPLSLSTPAGAVGRPLRFDCDDLPSSAATAAARRPRELFVQRRKIDTVAMLYTLLIDYVIFVDDHPYHRPTQQSGNMALFVTLFLICCIEVIMVKIITEEDREAAEIAEAAMYGSVVRPRHSPAYMDYG